jgi:two-component system chemotaxis response regulator CheY
MGKAILAVDDSATVRQMVAFTLKGAGHSVIEASDGRDALSKLGSPLAMVITGIGLIRELRNDPRTKYLPIVVLTTESETTKRQEARAAGATAWIVKPFRPEQLLAVVQKVIG